ncbi:4'-phosphopantetheinyl transferase Sfp [Sporomusa silvacetica DSM 10669]|uniref:4'-phosphopantetheinyl transferase Sfp n=1 Tax=Sporomusa silvacetica DSM 10669 TaxID=1123289 RepID=A0ABZ3IRY0_9FIRM|nr:4'-phosphopantetheinyl transferase superfamily protein [Sporomusa silvacetica]OZC15345.1 4'-phosphopantetheinyl transferase sfp [Sporomusa silvacetica DSM 10669]
MINDLVIYAARIPNLSEQDIFWYAAALLAERQKKITSYRQRNDRLRSLTAGLLLRQALENDCDIAIGDTNLLLTDYGKPYLAGRPNVNFNISHSGDWVVCAVDKQPVGIDIEKIEVPVDLKLVKHFFSQQEYADISSLHVQEQATRFFQVWTHKESYVKALGIGLYMPLNSFTVGISDNDYSVLVDEGKQLWFLKEYEVDKDYVLTVCAAHNLFPPTVTIRDVLESNKRLVV